MYGTYDLLANPQDVNELIQNLLPNNPGLSYKEYEAGHATFMWGANELIISDILRILS